MTLQQARTSQCGRGEELRCPGAQTEHSHKIKTAIFCPGREQDNHTNQKKKKEDQFGSQSLILSWSGQHGALLSPENILHAAVTVGMGPY